MSFEAFIKIAEVMNIMAAFAAIICFFRFRSRDLYIRVLGFFFVVFFAQDRMGGILYSLKINPNIAASVGNIISFPLVAWIYFLETGRQYKERYIAVVSAYVIFGIANLLYIQGDAINSYTFVFRSVCTIVFALYYFYWLLRELPTSQLQKLPMFWINSAYMVFASGTLFLYVFTSYLVNVMENDLLIYWSFHNILGIIEILMIIVALWMDLRNIKSHSLSP